MVSLVFGTGASVAQATTNPTSYVGIWKMTAQDKRVGTLELMNYNGATDWHLTNAHASMDSNGKLVSLTLFGCGSYCPSKHFKKAMLVIDTEQTDEAIVPWNMTLTGEGKGLLQLAFKGHEMTFQITRISWRRMREVWKLASSSRQIDKDECQTSCPRTC